MVFTSKDLDTFNDKIQNILENDKARSILEAFLKRTRRKNLYSVVQLWISARMLENPTNSDLDDVMDMAWEVDGISHTDLEEARTQSNFLELVQNLCYNMNTLWTAVIHKDIMDELKKHKKS